MCRVAVLVAHCGLMGTDFTLEKVIQCLQFETLDLGVKAVGGACPFDLQIIHGLITKFLGKPDIYELKLER